VSQQNVDSIRDAYAALNRGDAGPYFELFDEQGEFCEPASLPYGGTHHGHDGLQQLMGAIDELWGETQYHIDELLDAGEIVVVVGRVQSRARRTGHEIDEPLVEVLRFRDGKITSAHAHADTARFLQALDVAATAAT
jgi:ketosteroid isomerase-like protein